MLAITGPCQSARWTGGILWQAPGKAETYNYTLWFGRFWGFLPPQLLREIDHPRSKTLPQYHNLDKGNPSKLPYILASSLNPTQKWVNTICGGGTFPPSSLAGTWCGGTFIFTHPTIHVSSFSENFQTKTKKTCVFLVGFELWESFCQQSSPKKVNLARSCSSHR